MADLITSNYLEVIDTLTLKHLEIRAQAFLDQYVRDRPSVVLVPGGMGSRLLQTGVPFRRDSSFPEDPDYDQVWVTVPSALLGKIDNLKLDAGGYDAGGKPVIADGELNSVVKKYDQTQRFFKSRVNYTPFGYDWRRSPWVGAAYLRAFLTRIREGVKDHNPLRKLTLFAHSQGGLVTKLFINDLVRRGENPDDWFFRFVTAGTPFYGTQDKMDLFYAGSDSLNRYVRDGSRGLATLVATLPGPYCLMPAPRDVLVPRLANLGLAGYPFADAEDPDVLTDPFAPEVQDRFPVTLNRAYLAYARDVFGEIDRSLPEAVMAKIYHIRSNVSGDHPLAWTWQRVSNWSFLQGQGSPVQHNGGASDGTVPFWSARLAATPDNQVHDVRGIFHGDMAESEPIMQVVHALAEGDSLPRVPTEAPVPMLADGPDVSRALTDAEAMDAKAFAALPDAVVKNIAQGLAFI